MLTYGSLALKDDKVYTYEDYLAFDENTRCEIMDGYLYMMAAPSRVHQQVLMQLSARIFQFLEGKPCKVYPAPFSVIFTNKQETLTVPRILESGEFERIREHEADPKKSKWVVEPDISVICDKSKLTKQGCVGAPDFIIEITSPSNANWDLRTKSTLYMNNGVREYWCVDLQRQRVIKQVLIDNDGYDMAPLSYTFQDKVPSDILDGLVIDFSTVDFE